MQLVQCLKILFPAAVPDKDYFVRNDGDGDYISEWYLSEPKPSETELQTAWTKVKIPPKGLTPEERLDELENLMNLQLMGVL